MCAKVINTFRKLDTDTSFNKQENSNFYDAVDLRLVSDEALSSGALVNFKGTHQKVELNNHDCIIKGYTSINNTLVLFVYYNTAQPYSTIEVVDLDNSSTVHTTTVVYSDNNKVSKLGLDLVDSISVVGRYESEYSKKVYFAVEGCPLRYFNVVQSSTQNIEACLLDIIPNSSNGDIVESSITIVDGGNLLAGKIQYSFRLLKKYGAETSFSAPTAPISLTAYSPKNTVEFNGSDLETSVNKSVSMTLSGLSTDFDYVHLYAVHYADSNIPTVSLVSEVEIPSTGTVTIIDNGSRLGTITLEEYNSFGGRLFQTTSLATKNNMLFAANLVEDATNTPVDSIDCRAYRFKKVLNPKVYTLFNSNFTDGDTVTITVTIPGASVITVTMVAKTSPVALNEFKIESYQIASITSLCNKFTTYLASSYPGLSLTSTGSLVSQYSTSVENCSIGVTSSVGISSSTQTYVESTNLICKIYDQSDNYYLIQPGGNWTKYTSTGTVVGSGTGFDINDDTFDCINKYNDEFLASVDTNESAHPYPYMYNQTGSQYGGTGKIVSYEFYLSEQATVIDANGSTVVSKLSTVNDSYIHTISKSSLKQGEVYRFGLTFYDTKGKPYFTKWIGDIRAPYVSDLITVGSTGTGVKNLVISFSVNLANVDLSEIRSFTISMVERTQADQSIVCQGATWNAAVDSTFTETSPYAMLHKAIPQKIVDGQYVDTTDWEGGSASDVRKGYVHPLYSPELYYNGGIDALSGNYLMKLVAAYEVKKTRFVTVASESVTSVTTETVGADVANNYSSSNLIFPSLKISSDLITNSDAGVTSKLGATYTVIDSVKAIRKEADSAPYTLKYGASTASVQFYNRVLPYNQNTSGGETYDHMHGYGPSCGVFTTKVALAKLTGYNLVYIVDLYQNNATTRYGGNTYKARTLNKYYPVSKKIPVINNITYTVNTIIGDTYVGVFDGFTAYADPNVTDKTHSIRTLFLTLRQQVAALLPIESRINCQLSALKPSKYIFNNTYASDKDLSEESPKIALQETTAQGIGFYGTRYPTTLPDTIKYNTAYSVKPAYPILLTKPILFEPTTHTPSTIVASEVKTNGELVDNWTRFLYNNVIDLDASFGGINNLQHFNNKLYFFQEDAIGIAAVNERYLLNQDAPGQLALGTGGILERFDYIKYNEGITDKRHIIATNDSIYYYDSRRNVLTDISSTTVPLSIKHGVNSLVRTLAENISSRVAFGYNPKYKEVLFTIGDKTLVYNEHLDVFGPRHSYLPTMYLNLPDALYSFIADVPDDVAYNYLFKHDMGMYGEVYFDLMHEPAEPSSTSSITIIVNPNNTQVASFDSIDFRTEVYAEGKSFTDGDLVYETISSAEFRNSYVHATKTIVPKDGINLHPNATRIARRWTTTVPLVADGNTSKVTPGYGKRFVDTFLMVTLNFKNNNSKKFKLHDIITNCR